MTIDISNIENLSKLQHNFVTMHFIRDLATSTFMHIAQIVMRSAQYIRMHYNVLVSKQLKQNYTIFKLYILFNIRIRLVSKNVYIAIKEE